MSAQTKSWDNVAEELARTVGVRYEPDRRARVRDEVVTTLARELTHLDHRVVGTAVDRAFRDIRIALDWRRIICRILYHIPGTWAKVTNDPGFNASTMLLLTDGTVMCQEEGGVRWKKLRPDSAGSYVAGTWSDLAPMHHTRRYYASAVLRDGRVFVSGGEYSDAGGWTNKTEIYEPLTDTWTEIAPPTGWTGVGDAPCAVLADGRVFLGSFNSTKTAIYDPAAGTWAAGPNKGSSSSEESWVLLPDDTVVTVRCNASNIADKYVAASNTWVSGGTLGTNIIETSSSEIGAGVLLNDGRAWFGGANGHTAVYAPPTLASDPGTWTQGPDFPNDPSGRTVGCKDTPSCLMTNGKVLVSAGPVDGVGGHWLTPTYFYEYDGSALHRVTDPPNATDVPYIGRMLLLPTGQILFAAQTGQIYAYSYYGCPEASWRPQITAYPTSVVAGLTYTIHGTTFNGMSQAVGYGDDASAATNYPLVRIRHLASGRVVYCRTFDHSSMGVATGSAPQSTNFHVPFNAPAGASEITVVANGIASAPCPVYVQTFKLPIPYREIWQKLIGSLADGDLWVLGPNGPIPVDPWGPKYAHEIRDAQQRLIEAFHTFTRLGQRLSDERLRLAEQRPLAPDEGSEEDEGASDDDDAVRAPDDAYAIAGMEPRRVMADD